MSDSLLLDAADALEKAAAYIENIESSTREKEREAQQTLASKLAESVSDAVGEPVTDELIEKLSKADPDVRNLISKMTTSDGVDPMGGPETEVKTAGVSDEMGSAEMSLMSWLTT